MPRRPSEDPADQHNDRRRNSQGGRMARLKSRNRSNSKDCGRPQRGLRRKKRVPPDQAVILADLKSQMLKRGVDPEKLTPAFVNGDLDATLMRFLKARKFKVENALKMLIESLEWRKKNDVDNILSVPLPPKPLAAMRKYMQGAYFGYDREGRPLYIERTGQLNVVGLANSGAQIKDMVHKHIQEMEFLTSFQFPRASELKGVTVDKIASIFDVQGINRSFMGENVKSVFKAITNIDQNNYPETAGIILVVNAPWIFTMIWKIAQTFIDEGTRKKIKMLGPGKLDTLKDYVDPKYLPKWLGGDHDDDMGPLMQEMDDAIAEKTAKRLTMNSPIQPVANGESSPTNKGGPEEETEGGDLDDGKGESTGIDKGEDALEEEEAGHSNVTTPIKQTVPNGVPLDGEDGLDPEIQSALSTLDILIQKVNSVIKENESRMDDDYLGSPSVGTKTPESKPITEPFSEPITDLHPKPSRCCIVQ